MNNKKDKTNAIERDELSEKELTLLKTPDEELKKQAEVYSFDRARLEKRINAGDHWQQLLHGHIYIDHIITKMIEEALTFPNEIKIDRMAFSAKSELAAALGLLNKEILKTINKINSLRNKSIHQLEYMLTEKEIRDLFNVTPKMLLEIAKNNSKRKTEPVQLYQLIRVVIYRLEIDRQLQAYHRLIQKKSFINLKNVINDIEKNDYYQKK